MILKASVIGNIECKDEANAKDCSKILNKYSIKHTTDKKSNVVTIDTDIKVTPWFEREKFEHCLHRKLSEKGKCKISVSERK